MNIIIYFFLVACEGSHTHTNKYRHNDTYINVKNKFIDQKTYSQ
jgi:hypothetical protein